MKTKLSPLLVMDPEELPDFRQGCIHLYRGPMYSGKTEAVVAELLKREEYASNMNYLAFRPEIDSRSKSNHLETRYGGKSIPCIMIPENNPLTILDHIENNTHTIAVDEVQFFHPWKFLTVARQIKQSGREAYYMGLPEDYGGREWGAIPLIERRLFRKGDQLNIMSGCCDYQEPQEFHSCGRTAMHTQRYVLQEYETGIYIPSNWEEQQAVVEQLKNNRLHPYIYKTRCDLHWWVGEAPQESEYAQIKNSLGLPQEVDHSFDSKINRVLSTESS